MGSVVILRVLFTSQAWTARFAEMHDRGHRWVVAQRARIDLYRLLMPTVLGVNFAAPVVLRVVAPASFELDSSTLVVFVVALSAGWVASSGSSSRELLLIHKTRSIAVAAGAAALLNIGLNLVLVPWMGILGSAIAILIAFGLQAVLQLRALPTEGSPLATHVGSRLAWTECRGWVECAVGSLAADVQLQPHPLHHCLPLPAVAVGDVKVSEKRRRRGVRSAAGRVSHACEGSCSPPFPESYVVDPQRLLLNLLA